MANGTGIDDAAIASRTADRIVEPIGDIAVAFDSGEIDRFVVDAVGEAVTRVGGVATLSRDGSVGLQRVARNGVTVHAPPAGYLIPVTFVSLPREALGRVVGSDVSTVVNGGAVALNQITADLMSAGVGDTLDLRADNGSTVTVRVGGVFPNDQLGAAELVFITEIADRLGATDDTRVVMWGFQNRTKLDAALAAVGVLGRAGTKVVHSWDPPNPDGTLSTPDTKVALGEPWYRVNSDGSIGMHPDWKATNLTPERMLLNDVIRISAQCHVDVVGDLSAALAEVAGAGLASAIDVVNANTYGGCYNPRYSRLSGYLSRHAYGMALDTNTQSNCQGCQPKMNCDVVRIFRKHGFAWGGNFRVPDGMHFEWVGEPRHQIAYASKSCPNIVQPLTESVTPSSLGNSVLTIDDLSGADDHSDAP